MKSSLELLEWDRLCALLGELAETPLGRAQARRLVPSPELRRLEETAAAVREGCEVVAEGRDSLLAGATDLRAQMAAAQRSGSGLDGQELHQIQRTLAIAWQVRGRLDRPEHWPALSRRVRTLPDLSALIELLGRSVNEDGSVPDEASPELGTLRRERGELERRIRTLADRWSTRPEYQTVLRSGPPVLRNGRYMLAVRSESRGQVHGVLHDRSSSGATVFIEPFELVEPQNRLIDLEARERNLVGRILLDCTRRTLRHEGEIHETLRHLGSLDLVFARVRFGLRLGGRLIEVGEKTPMVLRQAYHPLLLEQNRNGEGPAVLAAARARVVPFDLELGGSFRVLMITGPNTGGKTVTLKAVGLLVLMALSAVPAPVGEGTRIPLYDGVHADIGDEQDLQQSLSTFSGHLRRVSLLLEQATNRSLVLLDELGTGTDPAEGEALSRALIAHLLRQGVSTLATTHLSGLKELADQERHIENASLEFDADTLQPLFRLSLGLAGESNALRIARRHGVPDSVVEEAERFLYEGQKEGARKATESAQRSRQKALEHLEKAEQEARNLEAQRGEFEARLEDQRKWAEGLEEQKEHEIDRALRRASEEALRHLEALGTLPPAHREKREELRRFLEKLPDSSSLTQRRNAYIQGLRRDDLVYLPRYRERCRVRRIDRGRRVLKVLYKALELEIPFSEVACPQDFNWKSP